MFPICKLLQWNTVLLLDELSGSLAIHVYLCAVVYRDNHDIWYELARLGRMRLYTNELRNASLRVKSDESLLIQQLPGKRKVFAKWIVNFHVYLSAS